MVEEILKNAQLAIAKASDHKSLDDLRVRYLGKKGELSSILKNLGNLPAEERPKMGETINKAKNQVQELISEKKSST